MKLPLPIPYPPMEAALVRKLPEAGPWQFEPKWDGFRCLVFRSGRQVELQSKAGRPLTRYFPEIAAAVQQLSPARFVLDGELVIPVGDHLSFDELLLRIHPAVSRVRLLAEQHPALLIVFDLLVGTDGSLLADRPLSERRPVLEKLAREAFLPNGPFRLSPATQDRQVAQRWLREAGRDLDGLIAKRLDLEYQSGERSGMEKVKPIRTADCVVGGFRYGAGRQAIGSLLLGLFNAEGLLDHVGYCSSLKADERVALVPKLQALIEPPGFTGHAPGGPSRWTGGRSTAWEPLEPVLVVEVEYDHFTSGRFRHGTKLVRWRPDKAPGQCDFAQLPESGQAALALLEGPGPRA